MQVGAARAWDLGVCNLMYQVVPEAVLVVAGQRRRPRAADELPACQLSAYCPSPPAPVGTPHRSPTRASPRSGFRSRLCSAGLRPTQAVRRVVQPAAGSLRVRRIRTWECSPAVGRLRGRHSYVTLRGTLRQALTVPTTQEHMLRVHGAWTTPPLRHDRDRAGATSSAEPSPAPGLSTGSTQIASACQPRPSAPTPPGGRG